MREIKFRAWDEWSNRMIFQHDMNCVIGNKEYYFSLYEESVELLHYDEDYSAYVKCNAELMQYTGLKDMNGKEVYEGDIVKEKYYEYSKYSKKQPSKSYGVIKRENKSCNLYIEWHFQDRYEGEAFWNTNQLYINKACEFEVIGNIYENKDLLD